VLTESGARWISGTRLPGTARGTGCRFASALATRLALGDEPMVAARFAKQLVRSYLVDPRPQE
jgi:hydroxymethylpyrimidine/phosphomethylpyrimidine kinase